MAGNATLRVNIVGNAVSGISAIQATGSALSGLAKVAGGVTKTVAAVWTGVVASGVGVAASAIKTGIAYNTLQQTSLAAFKTILGSGAAASKMMDQISAFAKTSPFPKQAFISATQQMLGFGIASDKVIPILGAVQDAVAATGGSADDITGIVDVLSKIQGTGKITAETFNQLGGRGIDAADLIAKGMGTTAAAIRDSVTDGSLDAGKALDALTTQMGVKFKGAAANVKQTWSGTTDRIKGAMRDIGSALVEPFISAKGGGLAVEWGNKLADILRGIQGLVKPVMDALLKAFAGPLAKVGPMLDKISGALKGLDASKAIDTLKGFAPALGALTAGAAAMTGGLASSLPVIGPLLSGLSGPVGILVAAIGGLIATSPELQKVFAGAFTDALKLVQPILKGLAPVLKQITASAVMLVAGFAPLIPVVVQLGAALGGVILKAVASLAVTLSTQLTPVLPLLVGLFKAVIGALAPLIPAIVPIIGQVIALGAALLGQLLPVARQIIIALGPAFTAIFAAIGTILPPLVAAFMALVNAILPILPPIAALITQLITGLMPVITNLIATLLPPLSAAFTALGALLPPIAAAFSALIKAVLPILPPIATLITTLVSGLLPIVTTLASALLPVFTSALLALAPPIVALVQMIAANLSPVLKILMPLLNQIGAALVPVVQSAMSALTPIVAALMGALKLILPPIIQLIGQLLPPLAKLITGVLDAIVPVLPQLATLATKLIDVAVSAITPLLPVLGKMLDALLPLLDPLTLLIGLAVDLLNPILSLLTPILDLASYLAGKLVGAVADVMGSALTSLAGVFSGIADSIGGLIGMISDVIGWFGSLIDKAKAAAGIKPPAVGKSVPAPEAMYSTPSSSSMSAYRRRTFAPSASALAVTAGTAATGPTVTPNVYAIHINDAYDPEHVARTVVDLITRYDRRRGGVVLAGLAGTR